MDWPEEWVLCSSKLMSCVCTLCLGLESNSIM